MQNNKKLRVGYLSPGWPLSSSPNGVIAYVENILTGLNADVSPVILTSQLRELEVEGFTIDIAKYNHRYANLHHKLLTKVLSKLKCGNAELIRYKNMLRDTGYMFSSALENLDEPLDILEMEESFGLNYYVVDRLKTRYVTRLHGPWFLMEKLQNLETTEQSKLRIFYEGEAIKNSHGVTSPSLDVLNKVREYYNVELPYAKVIPNPTLIVKKDKQWRLVKKSLYILFVGRFDSVKGGDLILDSFNIIAQTDESIMLYFVGPDKGVVVNGDRLSINEYIDKNIQNESIRKRIKFFGHCRSDQIIEMRQKARVTVCCSRYENFPISLLEALSTGCPTIATAVGGIKEIIADGYNGLFADPESPESIAEKVLMLLNDSEKSKLLSKHAIEDTTQRFCPKAIAKQSVDYYKSTLNRY